MVRQVGSRRYGEQVRRHQGWGYPVRLSDEEEFRGLEPNVSPGRALAVSYTEHEGSVDPSHATEILLDAARTAGAKISYPREVTGVDIRWGKLRGVGMAEEAASADVVVAAAGVQTPQLAAMAGLRVPLKESPGVLAHTVPGPRLINRVVLSPGAHVKQKLDGRIVAGSSFGGRPTTDASQEHGERVLADDRSWSL